MNNVKPPKMGAISKVFAGMEILDGVKKTRNEFKNTNNVYDDKLGVNMKGHKTFKTAGDELDDLLKVAGVGNWTGRAAREAIKRGARDLVTEFDAATANNVRNAISAAKNKKIGQAAKIGVKALPGVALNAGTAISAGIGTTKALDALDKKNSDENKVTHKIIGATVGAGLAATALAGGGMYQGAKIIKDNVKKTVMKHPLNQYANNNPTFKNVRETVSKVSDSAGKAVSKERKLNDKAKAMVKNYRRATDNQNAKYIKSMGEGLNSIKSSARASFKDGYLVDNPNATSEQISKAWLNSRERKEFKDALNKAKTSIRSADKDIDLRRINKMAGEELDTLIKIAGIDIDGLKSAIKPAIKGAGKAGVYVGDKIVTPALTAMSTTAAPIIATTLLSQKMLNHAKADKNGGQQASQVAPPPQTLVIKLDNGAAHQEEKVAAVDDQAHDIGNVLTDVLSGLNEIKGSEKLRTEKVHIGNGKKKTFRMQEQHGMDMMQP